MTTGAPDIPESWDVTSDSLAVWLARKLGVPRVLLVKSAALPAGTASVGRSGRGRHRRSAAAALPRRQRRSNAAASRPPARRILPRPWPRGASPVRCSAAMTEHILFVTGHLAKPRLTKLLARMAPADFTYEIVDIGVKVAALMTGADHPPPPARRPSRPIASCCPAASAAISRRSAGYYGRPVQRGPDEIFRTCRILRPQGPAAATSRARTSASSPRSSRRRASSVEAIRRARGQLYGATAPMSSISAACRTRPFPISRPRSAALKAAGYHASASIPPMSTSFAAAPRPAPDFLLSLTEETLRPADEVRRRPRPDPGPPRRSRFAAARHGRAGPGADGPISPIRSSTRSISASPLRSGAMPSCAGSGRRPRS